MTHFETSNSSNSETAVASIRVPSIGIRAASALLGLLLLQAIGCQDEEESARAGALSVPVAAEVAPVPTREDARPTIILAVLDTTRADAISAYGNVEGTTPNVDALAATGVLFEHAFAPSPWTVSSHASMFSGLRVDEHGVGLDGVYRVSDDVAMLAESLRAEGYETAGFAENALVSPEFGFDQGFDHYEVTNMADVVRAEQAGDSSMRFFGLVERVAAWQRTRDSSRPAFVFVNIMDAHDPYSVRAVNPWVPAEAPRDELKAVVKRHPIPSAICRSVPSSRDAGLLSGLYLGDVHAADAKLGRVLAALRAGSRGESQITIVTADHGEHLGEHDLMGHRFSARTPALHIPLVVNGAPDLEVGAIAAAVELRSLRASILCWAVGSECGASIARAAAEETPQPIFSIWSDRSTEVAEPVRRQLGLPDHVPVVDQSRGNCGPNDPVYGELVSMIRYPHKLHWGGGGVQGLFDLSWDPLEKTDQLPRQRESVESLVAELEAFVTENVLNRTTVLPTDLSEEAARTLKALGYVE